MTQIVCQNGTQKCLYVSQAHYIRLRDNIVTDFDDLSPDFDLMYVDDKDGDWMLIENQADLDRIMSLRKEYLLIKVLPSIQRESPHKSQCKEKVGKLIMTEQLKRMIEFVTHKHLERYLAKKMAEKMMKESGIMLEQKVPPSLIKLSQIHPCIEKRILSEKPNRKSIHLSPSKSSMEIKVEKCVISKLKSLLGKIVDQSVAQADKMVCKSCLMKEVEIQRLISRELMKKMVKKKENPQQC